MDEPLCTALGALAGYVVEEHPELAALTKRAREGFISESEALGAMVAFISEYPEEEKRLAEEGRAILAPLREAEGECPELDSIFRSRPDGLLQMNPLLEAALVERAQFDGDMPELRTGQLPAGVRPSVSVETQARNPVAVGCMLNRAADKMAAKVASHEKAARRRIERVAEGEEGALACIKRHGELVQTADGTPDIAAMIRGSAETDHPEYKRGRVPAPVAMSKPSGAELALMTPEERRQAAWTFLSTTHGRRSGVNTVRHLVAENLRRRGYTIAERDFDAKAEVVDPVALHEWAVSLGGEGAMQPSFSIVDTAAGVLAAALARAAPVGTFTLEVTTADRLADREVGWKGRLLE